MKEIFYPSLITGLLLISSPLVWAQVEADTVVKNSLAESAECDEVTAKETPNYVIEDWKTAFLTPGTVKRERQGFITVKAAKELNHSADTVWVDTRNAEEFTMVRIPKSINIPMNRLTDKSFLKAKSLVLVDQGFSVSKMEALYQGLTAEGFTKVSIVSGGLNAWQHAGEILEGNAVARQGINRISPQQFFPERKYSDLIVLDLDEIDLANSNTAIQQQLHQRLAKQGGLKNTKDKQLLIINEKGEGYELIEQAVAELDWPPVFYLQGGKQAYQTYLKSQQAIWNRPTEKQGKINTCGRRKR